MKQKIVTHLWYAENAEEAAAFYASLIPDSSVDRITPLPADSPSGPAGSVYIVDFTLGGQKFQAINAGPYDPFNHSFSLIINCNTQEEIDRLWDGLGAGGEIEECGWLKDRYGVSWQIVPAMLDDMMADKDEARAKRVSEAILTMKKLDIAALQAAYEGKEAAAAR